jgi:two-component system chemotaxis sensor kinase CheA
MDVVRRSVQALGGRISVRSKSGEGTTFVLSLPLTLAVLDGMLVSVRGQHLVAPLTTLIETVQLKPSEVRRLGPHAALLAIRGAHVPLIDLGQILNYRGPAPAPFAQQVALLIESDAGERAALLVDDILGQRQVVIKSLEANYRPVDGVAAATILGDGRVALILDVNAILARQHAYADQRDTAA